MSLPATKAAARTATSLFRLGMKSYSHDQQVERFRLSRSVTNTPATSLFRQRISGRVFSPLTAAKPNQLVQPMRCYSTCQQERGFLSKLLEAFRKATLNLWTGDKGPLAFLKLHFKNFTVGVSTWLGKVARKNLVECILDKISSQAPKSKLGELRYNSYNIKRNGIVVVEFKGAVYYFVPITSIAMENVRFKLEGRRITVKGRAANKIAGKRVMIARLLLLVPACGSEFHPGDYNISCYSSEIVIKVPNYKNKARDISFTEQQENDSVKKELMDAEMSVEDVSDNEQDEEQADGKGDEEQADGKGEGPGIRVEVQKKNDE